MKNLVCLFTVCMSVTYESAFMVRVNLKTKDLETAKQNIENYFVVAAITELFDESLFLMKKKLSCYC